MPTCHPQWLKAGFFGMFYLILKITYTFSTTFGDREIPLLCVHVRKQHCFLTPSLLSVSEDIGSALYLEIIELLLWDDLILMHPYWLFVKRVNQSPSSKGLISGARQSFKIVSGSVREGAKTKTSFFLCPAHWRFFSPFLNALMYQYLRKYFAN